MDSGFGLALGMVAVVLFGFAPCAGLTYGLFFLVTMPFRRQERARFFLDLLENGLKRGETPERTFIELGLCRDKSLAARVHMLSAYLEKGLRLGAALEKVPSLLPGPMTAMLKAGEEIGDVGKVLPACRRMLRDGQSKVRSGLNYMIIICLALLPLTPFVFIVVRTVVVPRYEAIFQGFAGDAPGQSALLFPSGLISWAGLLMGAEVILIFFVYLLAILYVGGPYFSRTLPSAAGLFQGLPWRRKRVQRDFSGMLAVLLDAGVPEEKAVRLAANSAANPRFARRAERVCQGLRDGLRLAEAVGRLDDTGEFKWRLANAARGRAGFLQALNGWLESLDARAFQQEQAASQLATTGLVLFNGLTVAVVALAIFLPLMEIINLAVLW
jgi:type II secretory pathway component PulF